MSIMFSIGVDMYYIGNFIADSDLLKFRVFVYDMRDGTYWEVSYGNEVALTGYSVYSYGNDNYAISGGMKLDTGGEEAYICDYNGADHTASNWRFYSHPDANITHFQGMYATPDNTGATFAADYIPFNGTAGNSFVYVVDINSTDRSDANVIWLPNVYNVSGVNVSETSANSVYYNDIIGFYETVDEPYSHAYIGRYDFESPTPTNDDTDDSGGNSNDGVSIVFNNVFMVAVGLVVVCIISFMCYIHRSKTASASVSTAVRSGEPSSSSSARASSVGRDTELISNPMVATP